MINLIKLGDSTGASGHSTVCPKIGGLQKWPNYLIPVCGNVSHFRISTLKIRFLLMGFIQKIL